MASKMATRVSKEEFKPESDADVLYGAVANAGTDEDTISKLLAHRTNKQRQEIASAYQAKYDKNMAEVLKADLSGDFYKVVSALMRTEFDLLAAELHNALQDLGTNEQTLVEILATLESSYKDDVKAAYHKLFDKNLLDDINDDTSGFFRQFLNSLLADIRNNEDNPEEATEKLLNGDENEWGEILSTNTFANLRKIFKVFENLASKTVEQAISDQFSGDVDLAFSAVVKSAENLPAYFAERLRNAMKGLGTSDDTLIRIIVGRNEIDLNVIQQEYKRIFEKELKEHVENDTSGPYKDTLLYLLE